MIVDEPFLEKVPQVSFAEYDEMVQNLMFCPLHPRLRKGIHPHRQLHPIATMGGGLSGCLTRSIRFAGASSTWLPIAITGARIAFSFMMTKGD